MLTKLILVSLDHRDVIG